MGWAHAFLAERHSDCWLQWLTRTGLRVADAAPQPACPRVGEPTTGHKSRRFPQDKPFAPDNVAIPISWANSLLNKAQYSIGFSHAILRSSGSRTMRHGAITAIRRVSARPRGPVGAQFRHEPLVPAPRRLGTPYRPRSPTATSTRACAPEAQPGCRGAPSRMSIAACSDTPRSGRGKGAIDKW